MENNPQAPENHNNSSTDDLVFFNVMPKISSSNMIMPKISSQTTVQKAQPQTEIKNQLSQTPQNQQEPNAKPSVLKRFKYILIFFILIILAATAYFIPKLFIKPETENSLIPKNLKENIGHNTANKNAWVVKYFTTIECDKSLCGDLADPDLDGITNLQEYTLQTDPNNKDSDSDGLSDGDEFNIFDCDPLKSHSSSEQYSDLEHIKGGFECKTENKLPEGKILNLGNAMKEKGLHQPSLTSLESVLLSVYKFDQATSTVPSTSSSTPSTTLTSILPEIDQSPETKQERDTQRSLTIKNFGITLISYYDDNKNFPDTKDFKTMYDKVKPYLKTATNPTDPINSAPYIYSYEPSANKQDFILSFYSESAGQLIKKRKTDAIADKNKVQAAVYDDQRKSDIESIRSALLIYSSEKAAGNQEYVFPTVDKYKIEIVPKYLSSVPKDPKNSSDYEYQVSETFDTFTLKAILDDPPAGKTGYLCNQEECREY